MRNSLAVGIILLFALIPSTLQSQTHNLDREQGILTSRIAPGEPIPVLIKLANFGNSNRVDVIINYTVIDSEGKSVIRETETVAVETTAQFVRSLSLPFNISEGLYRVESEIFYPDQLTPAVSSFTFEVEKKLFGISYSTFINYSIFAGVLVLLAVLITFLLTRQRKVNIILHDYSSIDEETRLYYEIISDIITQMRLNIGTKAIDLASGIHGLAIHPKNGKVLDVAREPSVIISELISLFEKKYGSRVNISMKPGRNESRIIIK